MKCKCSEEDHSHASTMKILRRLANYTWEAKLVIVLASFVVKSSQFSLVITNLDKSNPLISFVKKSKFEMIIGLVKAAIEMAKCIAEFRKMPSKYMSNDAEPMQDASAQTPFAAYWITRVIIVCASQLTEILGLSGL